MALEVDPSALLKARVRAQRNLNIHTCVCEDVCPFCASDLMLKELPQQPIFYDGAIFYSYKECKKCYSSFFINSNKKWAFLETGMT